MSHYLQINGLSIPCMHLANMVRCQAAAYAAWQRLPKIKPAGTLL